METVVEQRVARVEQQLIDLSAAFALHEQLQQGEFREIGDSLKLIEKSLTTRLPAWATLLMTGMGTVLGILVGVVSSHTLG